MSFLNMFHTVKTVSWNNGQYSGNNLSLVGVKLQKDDNWDSVKKIEKIFYKFNVYSV